MPLAHCDSCGSEHLPPVPCGLTFGERVRTLRTSSDWMPSRTDARAREHRQFYDHDAVDEQFGKDAKTRREELLADSRGYGNLRYDGKGGAYYRRPGTKEVRYTTEDKIRADFAVPK